MKSFRSFTKPLAAFSLLSVFSSPSFADIIKCSFTEPFAATTYSMAQQSLRIQTPSGTKVLRNVSFQIMGPARFNIVANNGRILQRLALTFRGSDGMSDRVYPYEATFTPSSRGPQYNPGGCSSNYLPAHGPR